MLYVGHVLFIIRKHGHVVLHELDKIFDEYLHSKIVTFLKYKESSRHLSVSNMKEPSRRFNSKLYYKEFKGSVHRFLDRGSTVQLRRGGGLRPGL